MTKFCYKNLKQSDSQNKVFSGLGPTFVSDKTKSIIFASKQRAGNICKLNIQCKEINIKQKAQVTHLGYVLGESMSGEPMTLKVINKINGKLKFLYRKNQFLTPELHRILYNALIQPHFDYTCPA